MRRQELQSSALDASPLARRKPSQKRAKATVTRLLDAVGEYVGKHGFLTLNTTSIAAQAGVSVGTLYGYFPDIYAVLEAYADRSLGEWLDRWGDMPPFEPPESWRTTYNRSWRLTLDLAKDDYGYVLLLNAAGVVPELDEVLLRIRGAHIQATTKLLRHANPALPPRRAEAIAEIVLRAGWAGIMDVIRVGDETLRDEYEQLLTRYLAPYLDGGQTEG